MIFKPLDEARRKALIEADDDFLESLKNSNPELYERFVSETRELMEKYGIPSIGGSFGGLWDEDCPSYVNDILSLSKRCGRPLRLIVEPESFDEDAHHWAAS